MRNLFIKYDYMPTVWTVILFTSFATMAYFGIHEELERHDKYGYPCELAEISPDIPLPVKDTCRKIRADGHSLKGIIVYYHPRT